MSETDTTGTETAEETDTKGKVLFGLTRKRRYKIYAWGALAIVLGTIIWSLSYLRLWNWHKYTDKIAVEKVAREVELGYVLCDKAEAVSEGITEENFIDQTVISSDGVRMGYSSGSDDENANLFLRLWDGNNWGEPRPIHLLH